MSMTLKDAWLYAATWGSAMTAGDPGACLYGFDESFRVQSETHRADCLAEMVRNRASVEASPDKYEPDEIAQIDLLCAVLKRAKLAGEPGALDGADAFTAAYVAAMLWTDNAPDADSGADFERLAASDDDSPEGSFPASCTADDIAPDALASITADCAAFQEQAAELLALAYTRSGRYLDPSDPRGASYDAERAGHDFWLTRNGHGTGFWDRSELRTVDRDEYEALCAKMRAPGVTPDEWSALNVERNALESASLGERLSELAKGFGQSDSYFGDDGRIYV